jgi:hypothetical protein
MNTVKETLVKLRELLSDPSRWTKRANAKAANGIAVRSYSPHAESFCLVGGLERVVGWTPNHTQATEDEFQRAGAALKRTARVEFISVFNDRSTHGEVLNVIDRAIEAAS